MFTIQEQDGLQQVPNDESSDDKTEVKDFEDSTEKMEMADLTFPSINLVSLFFMLALSLTFGFYTKVTFKSYGSLFHDDDSYLTQVCQIGLLLQSIFYMVWGLVL